MTYCCLRIDLKTQQLETINIYYLVFSVCQKTVSGLADDADQGVS
jgi:hypothetical protein